jgi:hypothetical protein
MMNDIAKRAVDSKYWKWTPGMQPLRWAPGKKDHLQKEMRCDKQSDCELVSGCVPDISDPATLGCMLFLIRDAWDAPDCMGVWFAPTGQRSG